MIKFFRQSYIIQYVVIALLAIILWAPAFVSGKAAMGMDEPVTPIFNLVSRLLGPSVILRHIVAFVLLVIETLLFNAIMVKNQIVGKVSSMGAFVFVLMMSMTQTQTNFYPFALSLIFLLLMLKNLYDAYLQPDAEMFLLRSGVFLALATMCYFPSIVLIVWMLVVLPMNKKGSARFLMIPLFGFCFVYFMYFVGVFLFGDFQSLLDGYSGYFSSLQLTVEGFNLRTIILLSVILVSVVFLFLGSNNANFEKAVAVRTKISMAFIMAFFGILLLFVGDNVLMNGLIFMVLSILVSYAFSYMGNTGWANLMLTIFILLTLANHYYFKLL